MDDKSKNIVEFNGRLFEAKKLGCTKFLPIDFTLNNPPEQGLVDILAKNMAREICEKMLEDCAITVETGPEFEPDTNELKGYIVAVRSNPVLFPIKSDE